MRGRFGTLGGLLLGIVLLIVGAGPAVALDFQVIRLSDDAYDDSDPRISGSLIVWSAHDGNDSEILLYDATTRTLTELTSNPFDDRRPRISGAGIAWVGSDGNDDEIFYYDAISETQLRITDNDVDDRDPDIWGTTVVWAGSDGSDLEIFSYDVATGVTRQFSDNGSIDQTPVISESNVAWKGGFFEVFYYDAASDTVTLLTDPGDPHPSGCWAGSSRNVRLSGSNVVWTRDFNECGPLIYLYEGATHSTTNLTDGFVFSGEPAISGATVVWFGWEAQPVMCGDAELDIFSFDVGTGEQTNVSCSPSDFFNANPVVSGSNIAWFGGAAPDYSLDVYFHDGSAVSRVSNLGFSMYGGLDISGSNVVWASFDGNDYEIFLAQNVLVYNTRLEIIPDTINPRSRGVIPVALLGSEEFDVADVDVFTLRFGPDEASTAHDLTDGWIYSEHLQDVNLDGYMDLITHFKTQDTGIVCGNAEATLSGRLLDGMAFEGTDTFRTVGCNSNRPGGGSRRKAVRVQQQPARLE